MANFCYVLKDPRDQRVRYVGITMVPIAQRLRRHIKAANNGSTLPVHVWIRKLVRLGLTPQVALLEMTADRSREVFWIQYHRDQGLRLLNCTRGGDGLVCPTKETRQKMSESHKGQRPTAEQVRKIVAARAGFRHSEESREKMRKPKSEQHRRNAAAALQALRDQGLYCTARGPRPAHAIKRGTANLSSKLTEEQIREIRHRYAAGDTGTPALARAYGVAQVTIFNIVTGKTWKHVEPSQCPRKARSKLTETQVREMRQRYTAGEMTNRELAAHYAVPERTVYGITRGTSWKHVH